MRKAKNLILALVCAYKQAHPEVVLARVKVGDIVGMLEGNGLGVYKNIDWGDEGLMRYIKQVLEQYSKSYKRTAEQHLRGLVDSKRLMEYVGGVGKVGENKYKNKNVGVAPFEIWCWDGTDIKYEGGLRRVVIIVDIASRCIQYWDEVEVESGGEIVRVYRGAIEASGGLRPRILHGDRGAFNSMEVRRELERDGVEHSTCEKWRRFGNNVIERLNGVLKNSVIPKILEGGGSMSFREMMNKAVGYYNDSKIHSLYEETPRLVMMGMMDMDREKIKGKGSGEVNSKEGGLIVGEVKRNLEVYKKEEIETPSLEEYGEGVERMKKFMRSVVVKPLMNELRELRRENMKKEMVWERDMEEMRKKYDELWEIVNARVKKLEKRGLEKERDRQKVMKRVNIGGLELRKVLEAAERVKGKDRYRVGIGIRLMYITGMRVGGLLLLDDKWFMENIIRNKGGDIKIQLTKQRGGEVREIFVGISEGNKRDIKNLYEEYRGIFKGELYSLSRVTLTNSMNKVLKVVGATSHSLRYTRITDVAKEKGIVVAKQYVGHRQLETTNRYVFNILGGDMRRAISERTDIGLVLGELGEEGEGGE